MPAAALSTGAKNKTPYLSDAAATAADGRILLQESVRMPKV